MIIVIIILHLKAHKKQKSKKKKFFKCVNRILRNVKRAIET